MDGPVKYCNSSLYNNASIKSDSDNTMFRPVGGGSEVSVVDLVGERAFRFVSKNSTIPSRCPTNGCLRVAHVNLRSLLRVVGGVCRLNILISFLLLHTVMICGVTETWLDGDTVPPDNQFYTWYGVNRVGRGGGVGLFVRHDIACKNITSSLDSSTFSELEYCAIVCNFGGVSVCVVCIYLPQRNDNEIDQCRTLLQSLVERDISNFILCGDFNSCINLGGLLLIILEVFDYRRFLVVLVLPLQLCQMLPGWVL